MRDFNRPLPITGSTCGFVKISKYTGNINIVVSIIAIVDMSSSLPPTMTEHTTKYTFSSAYSTQVYSILEDVSACIIFMYSVIIYRLKCSSRKSISQ